MRPSSLDPVFAPVTVLPGVGPRIARAMEKLTGPAVVHLLWHLPTGLVDRRYAPTIAAAETGRIATIAVTVDRHVPPRNPRLPYKVFCSDETGVMTLVFFHARGDWLAERLPEGQARVVSGRIERYGDEIQMAHPDHMVAPDARAEIETVEPVYGLSAGITGRVMARAVRTALTRAPDLAEWADPNLVTVRGWPAWHDALAAAHQPPDAAALLPDSPPRQRLAYDELLANQLALTLMRRSMRRGRGRPLVGDGGLRARVAAALPYQMTQAQDAAIDEIATDLAGETRMLRLLQGDVGSGKTLVALFAMLIAVEAGAQAAFMAPTELLARQHAATIEGLLADTGVRTALITGGERTAAREKRLAALADDTVDIAIGTHALFQEGVAFRNLALAVIDEQHRFGVHQRMLLARKGKDVDLLLMTATPIPRTLVLTSYGDMEVSRLTERPPGRRPIETRVLKLSRLDEVAAAAKRAVANGAKVYWVCPLVEESETVDLAAAADRHAALRALMGERVALVHGRMKGREKDAALAAFAGDGADVLVATTVIEVGVDVPAATIMVVEHAERFGLAQLHQLRGRVGRGSAQGTCLLLYAEPLNETARARLNIMRETDDGFRIAEEDLRLRGAGEVLGTRQSGAPAFHLADLAAHGDLLEIARDDVKKLLHDDPAFAHQRGEALRTLLYLFERDIAVRYLRSG